MPGISFQSLEGIQALWNLIPCPLESRQVQRFNPWKGFRLFGTFASHQQQESVKGFNPWKGFRLFGTRSSDSCCKAYIEFQSLEGIQALWNSDVYVQNQDTVFVSIPGRDSGSLERFKIRVNAAIKLVSIPGRDSGSLERIHLAIASTSSFISVSIPGRDSGSLELPDF